MKTALIVLFLTAGALAQGTPQCLGNLNTPGCKSFREMLDRKDSDILRMTTPIAYVCFTPKTDEFTLISFDKPDPASFEENPNNKYVYTALGSADISTFMDGVQNYSSFIFGTWTAYGTGRNSISFAVPPPETPQKTSLIPGPFLSINDSEIDASFSYQNHVDDVVTISIKIRRSTLRFQKTLSFSGSSKGTGINESGYCAVFK